jgi:dephospho-CoA kinase
MIILGLTGSIGMGKSTTAAMFGARGVPVWDADAAVGTLYGPGGAAITLMEDAFAGSTTSNGVDRSVLKAEITKDRSALRRIEAIVHPLVAENRAAFLERHRKAMTALVVLDIPLLFETGTDALCDHTIAVTAPPETQRARVLKRGTMSEDQLDTILAAQMPDADKRARADFVIETLTITAAEAEVDGILTQLKGSPDA